jgi:hypothetical protein
VVASIPAVGPEDDDAWLYDISPGVRAGQLRAIATVLGIAGVVVGGGGAVWGGLLTDSGGFAVVCFALGGLAALAGLLLAARPPLAPPEGGSTRNDVARDLIRARPLLARLAIAGTFVGAGLLAAGAATQGSTQPGGPGPTQVCLGAGACSQVPTGPDTPIAPTTSP